MCSTNRQRTIQKFVQYYEQVCHFVIICVLRIININKMEKQMFDQVIKVTVMRVHSGSCLFL